VKKVKFASLRIVKDMSTFKNVKEGDMFLYGESMIDQLKTKKTGNEISYYKITKINKKGKFSYQPVFDTLED